MESDSRVKEKQDEQQNTEKSFFHQEKNKESENVETKDAELTEKNNSNEKMIEEAPYEPNSSLVEEASQKKDQKDSNLPKTVENPNAMVIEEPISTKSREILYGEDATEETKKQIEALFETAQVFASKEEYQQAINVYNKIVKLNEKSTAAWIAMGHCFAMLEDNYRALQSYQQALNLTPESQKDDQLWFGIGLIYQKIEDWKNAETAFRNALKLYPTTLKGEILYHLGVIMKVKGDYQEGIKLLTNSILLGNFPVERMIDILCHLGTGLEELNETNEAIQTYKYALMLDENNNRALQCLGWVYFQQDKVNEALEQFTKASQINEDDSNTNYMKARCYLKMNQHNKAYECLSKSIAKESSNSLFWNSLGILFAELTQLKSAHECISNALKFNSKSTENFFNMGCLFELCSQWNDAILMYDKALELQPNFQLAQTRKQGVQQQMESKGDLPLEVQFKHHKFSLSFMKDIDKEKPLFFFPQIQHSLIHSSAGAGTGMPIEDNEGQQDQTSRVQLEIANPLIPSFQMMIPQVSNQQIESQAPNKIFATPTTTPKSNQNDVSSIFVPKQIISNSSSLIPNLGQLATSFVPIKPKTNPNSSFVPSQKNPLETLKGEEKKVGEDKNDKKISSKSFVPAGKSTTSPSEGVEQPQSSFRVNKNLTSSIGLRHDSLSGTKEESSKEKSQDGSKAQKTGFKLTQRANRGEEGLIPQKKIKLDIPEPEETSTQIQEETKQGISKTSSLVLRPSPMNK